jgi:putative redox protein
MYAARKGWPVENISVTVRHEKVKSEGDSKPVDVFTRDIKIEGDLDLDQRKRMLEIADKCPVHKTLHSENTVKTTESS